ncbi:MAG TPA: lysine--tRNA ligase [Chloroflexia bacterium]|nr:lysine--tRNA ligase [Chloroflexia bacterium]
MTQGSEPEQVQRDYAAELNMGDQERQRLAKLNELRAQGIDPYPPRADRTQTASGAVAAFEQWEKAQTQSEQAGSAEGQEHAHEQEQLRVTVVGRLRLKRPGGKVTFAHLEDESGRLQLFFRINDLQEKPWDYEAVNKLLDLGDFIQAEGFMFRTRMGEVTLHVEKYHILSKALHPLPEKYHGLSDVETRYRQRYLDLIANEEVRETFRTRSRIVSYVRGFLDARGFLEVETPVLQPLYGGAAARPFVTHHNALDQQLFLRIADELYLKRLIIGGFERVYEIGHDFRNEGIDITHNPEFTMLELYQAYGDYHSMMALLEEMVSGMVQEIHGGFTLQYQGQTLDFTPPWSRVDWRCALLEQSGINIADYPDADSLMQVAREKGADIETGASRAKVLDELQGHFIEPLLVQPTFLLDYPVEVSPLAKRKPGDPAVVERFEPFVSSFEIGNAFSELNDPLDQYERFREQADAARGGDEDAHQMDLDYVTALLVGMPPVGGMGVGIDRLTMLLTDKYSIRDVILFPHMRKLEQH